MKYLPLLMFLTACSFELEHSHQTLEEPQTMANSYTAYIATREKEPEYEFTCSEQLSRINDSTISPVKELLDNRYAGQHPEFALLDWNNDGFKDLFFEYYAPAGAGIKFRIDVYEYDPKIEKFLEEGYSYMNPSFYFDSGIITSHYWGNNGGFGEKYKVYNGEIDTVETIRIDIISSGSMPILDVNYIFSQKPFMDSVYISDTLVLLPPEYAYQKIIKTDPYKD